MRTLILGLALIAPSAGGQDVAPPSHPRKILTPDQIAYQPSLKTYWAQRDKLQAAAISAFDAEAAREKAPTCPNAKSTRADQQCVFHENDVTDANYKAFAAALRAWLALQLPGEPEVHVGPSGHEATPATNTAAFDTAEAAWHTYVTAECDAVDTLWRGGTIVNDMDAYCGIRMSRSRMHELSDAYDMQLRH